MLALFGYPGWLEATVLLLLILLIYSRRIPTAAMYLGRSLIELKKSLKGS